ncbi:MAG: GntR family transcriptional regulator [Rhodospirillaceae bacterium]|nr:GntR family transcriptional regulator [Rhodospirillaceae bacterium]
MADRAASRLREILEQEIIAGRHRPGERLDEVSLAKRFQVSRTPIREALLGLESSGLIELKPRRGAFVKAVSASDLLEMFEVMAELEAICVRLGSRRLTRDQETQLKASLADCEIAAHSGEDAYYLANETFHAVLYRVSGNGFLEAQALALQNRLKPFRRLQLRVKGRMEQSMAEHREIVEAICTADAPRAERAMKAHIKIQGEHFLFLLSALEDRDQSAA